MNEVSPDDLIAFLEAMGWVPSNSLVRQPTWYKRFPDILPVCSENSDKAGMVVFITEYIMKASEKEYVSYEMEMRGCRPDGIWSKTTLYSLNAGQVFMNLHNYVKALESAWIAINGKRPNG